MHKSAIRSSLALFIGFIAWVILFVPAQAETITHTDEIPTIYLPLNGSLSFPQFDPSLGILTSVEVSATGTITGSIGFRNLIPVENIVSGEIDGDIALELPNGNTLSAGETLLTISDQNLDGYGTYSANFGDPVHGAVTLVDDTTLAAFIGTGTVTFLASENTSWKASGTLSNIVIELLADGDFSATIVYNYAIPVVDLQKHTNGQDADDPSGNDVPQIDSGATVDWIYWVENTGAVAIPLADVDLTDSDAGVNPIFDINSDDGDGLLSPQEVWRYTATAPAIDLLDPTAIAGHVIVAGCDQGGVSVYGERETYKNVARVVVPGSQATDPSHYCNPAEPGIDIEKQTNGVDADGAGDANVPQIEPGETVAWTYVVRNTGNVTFRSDQVQVTDSDSDVAPLFDSSSDDGDGLLSPGEVWRYTASAKALDLLDPSDSLGHTIVAGCDQGGASSYGPRETYENIGRVVVPNDEDLDPSHYCNPELPGIDIEKLTNDVDADGAGDTDIPEIAPGASVIWTYVVHNTGNVSFSADQVEVTDSDDAVNPIFEVGSDDGDGFLSPGETWRYSASATALDLSDPTDLEGHTIVPGCEKGGASTVGRRSTYENIGRVVVPDDEDSDPSHYCNPAEPGISIEKSTNGYDADLPSSADVPLIEPGQPILWQFVVTNSGNITYARAEVKVTDSVFNVTPVLDVASDNGDALLSPDEQWIYTAVGAAVDLTDSAQTVNLTVVEGCGAVGSAGIFPRPTYENIGRVTTPHGTDSDYSHYCNPLAPTSIELTSFTATPGENGILVVWNVAMEMETAGYNLYRGTSTDREQAVLINPSLIPTSGETAGAEASLRYEFPDTMAVPYVPYSYWLQEIEENGVVNEYGPVSGAVIRSNAAQEIFLPLLTN